MFYKITKVFNSGTSKNVVAIMVSLDPLLSIASMDVLPKK